MISSNVPNYNFVRKISLKWILECFDQANEPIKVKNLFKFYGKMEGFDNKDTMLIN